MAQIRYFSDRFFSCPDREASDDLWLTLTLRTPLRWNQMDQDILFGFRAAVFSLHRTPFFINICMLGIYTEDIPAEPPTFFHPAAYWLYSQIVCGVCSLDITVKNSQRTIAFH